MIQWRIVPFQLVIRGLTVVNGGWVGKIINNKFYVDNEACGVTEDGSPAIGGDVFDFWPEDCKRLDAFYDTYWPDHNKIYDFAQALYEADRNQPGRTLPYDEFTWADDEGKQQ